MKHTEKLFFAAALTMLAAALLVFGVSAGAARAPAIVNSGYCGGEGDGTNLRWMLDSEGTLFISGEGRMKRYSLQPAPISLKCNSPWAENESVSRVVVSSGVTTVDELAFYGCVNLRDAVLPDSLTELHVTAFAFCNRLENVFFEGGEAQWEEIAVSSDFTYIASVLEGSFREANVHFFASDHSPGPIVIENVFPATCTDPGRLDQAVYCTVCGAELSRRSEFEEAAGHIWGEWEVVKKATTEEEGLMRRVCENDPAHTEEEVIPKLAPQTNAFAQFIARILRFFRSLMDLLLKLFRF